MSPSLRGRGLKFPVFVDRRTNVRVALFTRAWIEMAHLLIIKYLRRVALFTRAWIEIAMEHNLISGLISRPLYEGVD